MFLFRSHPASERPSPLPTTPIPTHDERRARHLRQCERLAELGMELAEAAHAEALADIQPRPARRPSIIPGEPDVVGTCMPRDTIFGHLFAQLARCVRQTILLEARLAAGTLDRAEPAPSPARTADPAPPPNPIRPAAGAGPRLRPERMEDESQDDANRTPEEILTDICTGLGQALKAGLTPARPAQDPNHQDKPAKPRRPPPAPPPLTQFERSVKAAIQQGIPPPPGWR